MRKLFYGLTLLLTCSFASASTLGNCTVQYKIDDQVVTKQCSRFDQQENNGEFGIGVREDNLVIAFIGNVNTTTNNIIDVKLTKIYVNNIDNVSNKEYSVKDNGFCKFKKGNAVQCQSGDFMLNATY